MIFCVRSSYLCLAMAGHHGHKGHKEKDERSVKIALQKKGDPHSHRQRRKSRSEKVKSPRKVSGGVIGWVG